MLEKAEVNKLKNDKTYSGGLTLAGSKYSGLIDVDLYYDKADAWYYNALTMYYKTVKRSFDYDNKDWIQSFEKAIELTADINRKEDLVLELDNLKKEQAAIADQRVGYEKELRETITNDPESLDGKYLVIRHNAKNYSGILSFFEGKLYHIPVPLGSTDKITEIADIDTLCLLTPNKNVTQRKDFFAQGKFYYESIEESDDYGSYKGLNIVSITTDRNETSFKEVERMGVSFN